MAQRIRLAVVMDPIEDIKYAKDSTLAMLLAASKQGYELWYLTQPDLYLRDGVARCRARPLEVRADPAGWFTLGEASDTALGGFDVILMRKDPPFDMEFIYTTYILERAELAGALVVNRPAGLRDMNEKVYTAWFPEFCAPTLVTRDMASMAQFAREFERVVVKPLHGMGGRSIFVVGPERQEPQRGVRDTDRLRHALRHRAEIPAGDRDGRRFARAGDRRATGAVRTGPHAFGHRQPRQPGCRRQGRVTRTQRARPRDRRRHRPEAGGARHAVRRAGRDRRLRHRDQCHQPHRYPRNRQGLRHDIGMLLVEAIDRQLAARRAN